MAEPKRNPEQAKLANKLTRRLNELSYLILNLPLQNIQKVSEQVQSMQGRGNWNYDRIIQELNNSNLEFQHNLKFKKYEEEFYNLLTKIIWHIVETYRNLPRIDPDAQVNLNKQSVPVRVAKAKIINTACLDLYFEGINQFIDNIKKKKKTIFKLPKDMIKITERNLDLLKKQLTVYVQPKDKKFKSASDEISSKWSDFKFLMHQYPTKFKKELNVILTDINPDELKNLKMLSEILARKNLYTTPKEFHLQSAANLKKLAKFIKSLSQSKKAFFELPADKQRFLSNLSTTSHNYALLETKFNS